MRNVATVVFVFVFVAIGAAAQTLRWPVNSAVAYRYGCLLLANNPDVARHGVFQTDILESAGADRVRARFLVSNRCRVAVRVMGGLRGDGSEIEQRGRIEVLAVQDAPGNRDYADGAVAVGRAFMPSFVVPANGRTEVSVLVVLDGAVTSSEVAVVVAPTSYDLFNGAGAAYTRGGSRVVSFANPDDVTGWCAHYEDRRCGEY